LRLGGGAGFAGDRLDAAVDLARHGALDWLVLECLAERTIALAQLRRRRDAGAGYDERLAARVESLLPVLDATGTRLVSNFGAANPLAAAEAIVAIARGSACARAWPRSPATTSSTRSTAPCARSRTDGRSPTTPPSPPTPTSAPTRCFRRSPATPRSSSPAVSRTRRCSSRR
jgi:hypothetical protein